MTGKIEKELAISVIIGSLAISAFAFLSQNTGFTIANITTYSPNVVSGAFLILGIVAGILYLRLSR